MNTKTLAIKTIHAKHLAKQAIQGYQGAKPVLLSDIYSYVAGTNQRPQEVEAALNTRIDLRRKYQQLLAKQTGLAGDARAAAATESDMADRIYDHFSIKTRVSASQPEQTYIVLALDPHAGFTAGDVLRLHVSGDSEIAAVTFPPLHDLRTQLIVESNARIVSLLKQPKTVAKLTCAN